MKIQSVYLKFKQNNQNYTIFNRKYLIDSKICVCACATIFTVFVHKITGISKK